MPPDSVERLEGESDESYRLRLEAFEKTGALIKADNETLDEYHHRLFGRLLTDEEADAAKVEVLRALRELDPADVAAEVEALGLDVPPEAMVAALAFVR